MFRVVGDSLGCLGMKVYGFTGLDCWLVNIPMMNFLSSEGLVA